MRRFSVSSPPKFCAPSRPCQHLSLGYYQSPGNVLVLYLAMNILPPLTSMKTKGSFQRLEIGAHDNSHQERIAAKMWLEYRNMKELPFFLQEKQPKSKKDPLNVHQANVSVETKLIMDAERSQRLAYEVRAMLKKSNQTESSNALTLRIPTSRPGTGTPQSSAGSRPSTSLIRREDYRPVKPDWHAPWKLKKVIRYVIQNSLSPSC